MKKIIAIFLCLIMCLLFASCSVSQKQEQQKDKEDYDYSEDYISMYRANNYNSIVRAVKAKNGKYYINIGNLGYDKDPIYELSALEFNKSCESENLLTYYDVDEYYYNYGSEFIDCINLEDGEISLMQTYKNYLYVLINSNIYKINCNNPGDITSIYNDASTFFFYKDEMYIVKFGSVVNISRADLNGNITGVVINGGAGFTSARDDELYNVYASDDYLYFVMCNDGFESNTFLYCRCKLDGSEKEVWKIVDNEIPIISANEKNVAVVRNNINYETDSVSSISVEIYNSTDLSLIKDFSIDLDDEMNEMYEILNGDLMFPVYYNKDSIEFNIVGETFDMREWLSERLIINTDTELARYSSFKGLLTKSTSNEFFTAQWEMTGEESAKLYFYKVSD